MTDKKLHFIDCACPLCGSYNGKTLFKANMTSLRDYLEEVHGTLLPKNDLENETYHAKKCECGMMYQARILDEPSLEVYYNEMIPKEVMDKHKFGSHEHYYSYAREAGEISHLVGKEHKDIKVLDFGMGGGYWCLMAKAFGYDTYGYDLSKERREYAQRELGINVLNILKGRYDFINVEQVLEHIPNPVDLLSKISLCLNEGGYIHLSVPNARKLVNGFKNPDFTKAPWKALLPLGHLNGFTHKTLIRTATMCGLEPIPQPLVMSHRYTIKSFVRGLGRPIIQDCIGTNLYFKKNF